MAITQTDGPRNIGFFGTRNMGFSQQQLIEILSYAMVLTVRPTNRVVDSNCRACWLATCRCPAQLSATDERRCAQNNHIFTSGATGTNAAVIRGAPL